MKNQNATQTIFRGAWGIVVLLLGGALWLTTAVSGETSRRETDMIARGSLSYHLYCSNCHGAKGKGDGNLKEYLNVQPADLTRISARRGGTFPADEVARIIDGRQDVKGHGQREMPIWGDAFQEEGNDDSEAHAEQKIQELVLYLKAIQEKEGER